MEKIRPIIKDGKIINLNEIITFINQIDDKELLNDYLIEITEYKDLNPNQVEDFNQIKEAAVQRLNQLKAPPSKEILLISNYEYIRILAKLYKGEEITAKNNEDLYLLTDILLQSMSRGIITKDSQGMLDTYIYYLKDKRENQGLNHRENNFIKHYDYNVSQNQKRKENEYRKEDIKIKELKFKQKQENTRGAIISVAVLEITILLGIFISVLALANN